MEQEIMGKKMGHYPPQTTITSISVRLIRDLEAPHVLLERIRCFWSCDIKATKVHI